MAGIWIDGEKLENCPECSKSLTQEEYDFQFCKDCRHEKASRIDPATGQKRPADFRERVKRGKLSNG